MQPMFLFQNKGERRWPAGDTKRCIHFTRVRCLPSTPGQQQPAGQGETDGQQDTAAVISVAAGSHFTCASSASILHFHDAPTPRAGH
eukprot:COSAG01_NODE_3905_length_5559_cov_13.718498_3_plen_87_part_00